MGDSFSRRLCGRLLISGFNSSARVCWTLLLSWMITREGFALYTENRTPGEKRGERDFDLGGKGQGSSRNSLAEFPGMTIILHKFHLVMYFKPCRKLNGSTEVNHLPQ